MSPVVTQPVGGDHLGLQPQGGLGLHHLGQVGQVDHQAAPLDREPGLVPVHVQRQVVGVPGVVLVKIGVPALQGNDQGEGLCQSALDVNNALQ